MAPRTRIEKLPLFAPGRIRDVTLKTDRVNSKDYAFRIPAVRDMGTLKLNPKVTFLVGENGSGKSTLIEAIAVAVGFNAEGGSRNHNFAVRAILSQGCMRRYRSGAAFIEKRRLLSAGRKPVQRNH